MLIAIKWAELSQSGLVVTVGKILIIEDTSCTTTGLMSQPVPTPRAIRGNPLKLTGYPKKVPTKVSGVTAIGLGRLLGLTR